jgi:hypothetical protein
MRSVIIAAVAATLATSASAQGTEPSFAETLAWMDGTYNGGSGLGRGYQTLYSAGKSFKRLSSRFSYSGCQMTLHSVDDSEEIRYEDDSKFNLKDIDLSSIKVEKGASEAAGLSCDAVTIYPCDIANLYFTTTNEAPLIKSEFHNTFLKLKGSDHENSGSRSTHFAIFRFTGVEYADRFANAFRHAIKLCGGKAAPF